MRRRRLAVRRVVAMSDEITLRRGTRSDRSLILHLHRELYVHYRDQIMAPELADLYGYVDLESALRDDVDALLHRSQSLVLLAERDGEPLGYITGHIENDARRLLPKKGVVEDWLVVEGARGTGLGKRLMHTLIAEFERAGCDVVESGTWAFNTGAREAHQKAGFREIEVRFRKSLRE